MKCPKCRDAELETIEKHGIELDQCPTCQGMWFDQNEVDELEDVRFDEDDLKGSLVASEKESEFLCPKCQKRLSQFNYRFYGLILEHCPDGDGFWLDQGEDEEVLQLMDRKIRDLNRKASAEKKFYGFLSSLRRPSFFSKLRGLFKR